MRLNRRVADLESRHCPPGAPVWLRIIQNIGQTREDAFAAHEADNGPIGDSNVILVVIV